MHSTCLPQCMRGQSRAQHMPATVQPSATPTTHTKVHPPVLSLAESCTARRTLSGSHAGTQLRPHGPGPGSLGQVQGPQRLRGQRPQVQGPQRLRGQGQRLQGLLPGPASPAAGLGPGPGRTLGSRESGSIPRHDPEGRGGGVRESGSIPRHDPEGSGGGRVRVSGSTPRHDPEGRGGGVRESGSAPCHDPAGRGGGKEGEECRWCVFLELWVVWGAEQGDEVASYVDRTINCLKRSAVPHTAH